MGKLKQAHIEDEQPALEPGYPDYVPYIELNNALEGETFIVHREGGVNLETQSNIEDLLNHVLDNYPLLLAASTALAMQLRNHYPLFSPDIQKSVTTLNDAIVHGSLVKLT